MTAAAALYQPGKVKAFIVSGDKVTHQYDEPSAIQAGLRARVQAVIDVLLLDNQPKFTGPKVGITHVRN